MAPRNDEDLKYEKADDEHIRKVLDEKGWTPGKRVEVMLPIGQSGDLGVAPIWLTDDQYTQAVRMGITLHPDPKVTDFYLCVNEGNTLGTPKSNTFMLRRRPKHLRQTGPMALVHFLMDTKARRPNFSGAWGTWGLGGRVLIPENVHIPDGTDEELEEQRRKGRERALRAKARKAATYDVRQVVRYEVVKIEGNDVTHLENVESEEEGWAYVGRLHAAK